jgi:tetratricopeptide (TPR) repeat protein
MTSESRITPDRAVLVGSLLAVLVYIQDLRYDFILDDVPLILMNENIASWRNWKMAFLNDIFAVTDPRIPFEITALHYRPVYKLWQMLHAQLFGFVVPWWHLTSLLLHFGATLLVYQLGIKLLKQRWTAALAALLFAFHPIHVESVAYVTASTDLLVTCFALISFLAYYRFRQEGGSNLYFVASVVLAAMAMLSKESAVMFPWLLVAYEALRETPPGTEQNWKRFAWTLPFFAVVGAYIAVRTLLFGLNTGPGPGGNRIAALLDIPLVLVVYLRNFLWPFRLSFFYPAEWGTEWTLIKGASVVLTMIGVFYLWNRYRDRSGMRLLLVWAAIVFVPVALGVYTFVREDWVHDRHMYLVSVPLCLIAAGLLTDPKWPAKASVIVSALVLAILLIGTFLQVPRFSDEITIYASALKVSPRSVHVHDYYAEAFWMRGRYEDALREFKITTELAPQATFAHEGYGEALARLGRDDEAMVEFGKSLQGTTRPTPFRAYILSEIARIELKRSEFTKAADHMREAVQIDPEALNYHSMLAEALSQQGYREEADEEMRLDASIRQRFLQTQRNSRN